MALFSNPQHILVNTYEPRMYTIEEYDVETDQWVRVMWYPHTQAVAMGIVAWRNAQRAALGKKGRRGYTTPQRVRLLTPDERNDPALHPDYRGPA